MLKKIFNKLINPILFYTDKSGSSVFRNYCLYKNDGCQYPVKFPMQEAGKALEYRFMLNKRLKRGIFLISIILYFLFINVQFTLANILWFEFVWLISVFGCRFVCSYHYSKYLVDNFGEYKIVDFTPKVGSEKISRFRKVFAGKVILGLLLFIIFITPALVLFWGIRYNILSKKPNFSRAVAISNIYKKIYPKTKIIYDMSAYAKYMLEDYKGSADDYKVILRISGKNFENKDFTRFANLLHLEKRLYGAQGAVDDFNDYATRKKMSVSQQTKMLWIKSMYSVKNNVANAVIQDYNDLLESLDSKDYQNKFYISCDKAYMLYLLGEYESALELYNVLIPYAQGLGDKYSKQLRTLYAERGFTNRRLGYNSEAQEDFVNSKFDLDEINAYEPSEARQGFIVEKF